MSRRAMTSVSVAVLIGVALATGCGHKNPLVGTWTGSQTSPQGVTVNTTLTLTDDGKDTRASTFSGPRGNTRMDGSGTYTVSGNTLTLTYTTLELNGRQVPQTKGPIPEPNTFALDGDTLTLVDPKYGNTDVLTRQK